MTFIHRVVLISIVGAACAAAAKRGVTAEDYYSFRSIPDVRISPDGHSAAYVITSADDKRNRRDSEIWVTSLAGASAARQLTTGQSARMPRWSPDGRQIAFISTRPAPAAAHADRPQIFLLSLNGGEAHRLTTLEHGVEAFQWSPTGDRIVCVSKTGPNRRPFDQGGSDVRYYTSATYKFNDTGFYDERRTHLFVVDAQTGQAKQITSGAERNDVDPQWSPDGSRIAFVTEDTTKPVLMNNDVLNIPAAGGDPIRINKSSGSMRLARWSPDGKRIAYAAAQTESDVPHMFIASAQGGESVRASQELDIPPTEIRWAAADAIIFEGQWHGEIQAYRLNPNSGKFAALTSGPRACTHADVNPGAHTMAYVVNDFQHPDELYASDDSGAHERRLTNINAAITGQLQLQEVEKVSFKGADGWPIDGFFVKPVGWQAGAKYPMVLSIHGGPASMYGVDWFHEFQVYASHGWAVFYTNPRGSTGYGAKFQRAVELNWGGKAYDDIMAGVDAILAKNAWIDRDRVGVTGGSYGGFMTNWILGHTNRFRAAVTVRSISNFTSVEGTRDAAYSHARDFGGDLFKNFDFYWNSSPLKYAANVKTPTLVMHSDNDQRVPIEQGEQWFRALKHFGVTTELVIFPRENHNLTRSGEPRHLVESINWQVYWFDRFLNGNDKAVPPAYR
jgi:dipeptidyl aminopeptidase/acylaminoacyl peptidase